MLSGPAQAYWRWIVADHFLGKVRSSLDWLGVQYYYDSPVRTFRLADEDGTPPRTDMGWRITPEGLYHVVREAYARYGVPIIVSENGLADASDSQRARFLLDHLAWLHRAIDEGADVRGYLHWSMLDNFEWAAGFGPRFGLAEVDYATFERTLRPSAATYGAIASSEPHCRGYGGRDDLCRRHAEPRSRVGEACAGEPRPAPDACYTTSSMATRSHLPQPRTARSRR